MRMKSLDEAKGGKTRMLYILTALGCIGGLLFGYDTGIISGALVLITSDFNLTDMEQTFVVSLTVVGALVSSIFAGSAGDAFGRKPVVLASSMAFIIGAAMMALTNSIIILYIGRFIVGLGVGTASLIVPVYLAECAPAEHRGQLVACVNVCVTGGQLLACIVAGLFSEVENGWRYMLGLAGIPAILQLIGFGLWVPESPRYLIQAGYTDVGSMALRKLRETLDVHEELSEILKALRNEEEALWREAATDHDDDHTTAISTSISNTANGNGNSKSNVNDNAAMSESNAPMSRYVHVNQDSSPSTLLSSPSSWNSEISDISYTRYAKPTQWRLLRKTTTSRALLLGCLLQAGQQFAGINTVMYFGATIFTLGGSSHTTAIWLTVGLSACNFIGSSNSFYLQDKLGRRMLTTLSMCGVSLSLCLIAGMFYLTEKARHDSSNSTKNNINTSSVSASTWIIFSSICMYLIIFASGMGSTPWTVCAEIYPTSVRGAAVSITTSMNWVSTLIMSSTFLSTVKILTEGGAFLAYAGISFAFFVFYHYYLPETKSVTLENIPRLFQDDKWGKQHVYNSSCFPCWSREGALADLESFAGGEKNDQKSSPQQLAREFSYTHFGADVDVET